MPEGKVKLPQDLLSCPLSELEAYINAHLPGGHKHKLAEAVLTLRKGLKTQVPQPPRRKEKEAA